MKYILVIICLFAITPFSIAESEGKSKDQIEGESDSVIIGTVQSVTRYKKIDEFTSYYRAEIKLETIEKGLLGERQIALLHVYYRNATKEGVFSEHSARLQSGQKVKLYLQMKVGIADEGFVFVIPSQERVEIR